MSYGWWFLVIFLTALVTLVIAGRVTSTPQRESLARLADPAPLPGELPRAGLLPLEHLPASGPSGPWLEPGPYGPWPVDTGPLLIVSEKDAANAALEREIPRLCAEAEAKIPPRWR